MRIFNLIDNIWINNQNNNLDTSYSQLYKNSSTNFIQNLNNSFSYLLKIF